MSSLNIYRNASSVVALVLLGWSVTSADETPETPETPNEPVSFYKEIRPIFQAKCQGCHQPAKSLGDYVMTSFDKLIGGGETGDAAIVPGKPDESYLVDQIVPVDGEAAMPKNGPPLEAAQIAKIRQWIAQGAKDDTPESASASYSEDNPPKYRRPPVITSLDHSPDGKLLAVAGFSEVLIHRADAKADEDSLVARFIGMSERIESVRFSPDGTKLAVCGGSPGTSGEVQIWDVASGQLKLSHPVTFDTVYGASWSPDGKLVAFGCADSAVRAIDATSGEQVLYQGSPNDWVFDTVFSKDGSHLVSVGRDMTAKLIEVKTQRFVDNVTSITPKALKGGITSIVRHPNRDEILFGGADGVPKIYRMHRITARKIGDDANQLWALPALPGRVFAVDYSDDATRIAAGSSLDGKGAIRVFGIDPDYQVPKEINGILIKPTHTRSGEERQKLAKYFEDGIQVLAKLDVDTGIFAVSLSPDGKQVAAAGADGTVRILNGDDGAKLREFIPVRLETESAASSANANTVKQQTISVEPKPLPPGAEVAELLCEPATISLGSITEYTQVIVTATLTSGDTVDVTRLCRMHVDGGTATVSSSGVVTPLKDGASILIAELGELTTVSDIVVSDLSKRRSPDYVRDVMPVISRMGCNAGTCHGSKDGKNGFKLSLRGYDPIYDVRAFTDDIASRRINFASPDDSLMLLKCTSAVPHEGGQITEYNSKYYNVVRDWIADGAKLNLDSARVTAIDVSPVNPVVQQIDSRQQMRVVATYADGSKRDVTQEAFIESGNTDVVEAVDGAPGLITVKRRGEAPVLVRFEGNYAATTVTVMGDRTGFEWQEPPKNNAIDGFVAEKLRRTKTLPSALCNDYEFIRRIHLDLTGLPPTAEEIREFVNDPRDSRWKRDELIDELIGSAGYIDHWTNKWADLLQVNRKFLGSEGAAKFRGWIHDQVEQNLPYDQFVQRILTASGSNLDNPAASYYKILRTPEDTMENTTHLFLATRFNCNKCHDHPFERWTQDQYYEMAAFFAQVGRKKDDRSGDKQIGRTAVESGKPLYEVVFDKTDGEVKHDRTGEVTAPDVPFEATTSELPTEASRRQRLAAWITSKDNQYFAKSYVNRLWGYLTGTGIIEPIDDIRAGNPPTNPELLDWLTSEFIESGFNSQEIVRAICKSRTYQLSIRANKWNEDDKINYSHAKARRLPAEVLYDTIHVVTGAKSKFPGVPEGTRAAALPDVGVKLPDGFLGNLGRPARESACECERSNDLQLGPVMALVSGPTVGEALAAGENAIGKLVGTISDDRELFNELFVRILNRPASGEELAAAIDTMNVIEDEHEVMSQRLALLERKWKPQEAELEAKRWTKIAKAESALNAYLDKTREAREKAKQDRDGKIAAAEAALAKYEAALPDHLARWEQSDSLATEWNALNFNSMTSSFGAKLEVQDDGSIFASEKNGRGNYDLETEFHGKPITGLRIEALTDDRLPKKGPGRADDGNFVLSEFKVQWANPSLTKEVEVATWKFAEGLQDWQPNGQAKLEVKDGVLHVKSTGKDPTITRKVQVPGALFMLEVQAKLKGNAESQLFWSTKSKEAFDEARSVRLTLAGQGQWLPYRYYFRGGEELTGLRFDPDSKAGQIDIREIKLFRIEAPKFQDVALVDAQADFSQKNYDVSTAIDGKNGDNNNGWAVSPQTGKPHQAIFAFKEPVGSEFGAKLKLTLMQNFRGNKFSLGRFRISLTTAQGPHDFGLPQDVKEILDVAKSERSEEQRNRLLSYFSKFDREIRRLRSGVEVAKKPLPEDQEMKKLEAAVAVAQQPIQVDPALLRLRREVRVSTEQLKNKRLTAAQDVAWALINNPAFLFNH